ncbi:DNA polymerase III, epsilon subunit [Chitinispirillum alkaliphilum]|nr:DNA polymerase III, epsilon subunit [Chitinispirillum alkaliphilum]
MPRLFDLIPDNSRKELITEARKTKRRAKAPGKTKASAEKIKEKAATLNVPDFVAFDVETTGLDFKNDRIIEIGAVRFINGKPEEEFSTFINAGVPIPEHITRLTSITEEQMRTGPTFSETAVKLLEFIGDLPLCGHQVEFDATFINEELKRASFPSVSMKLLDTALLSRILLQETGRFSLKHVCATLSVTLDNAHRALHDARASGEVAAKLVPRLATLPLNIRQTLAVCAPGSLFKTLMLRTLGKTRAAVSLNSGIIYKSAQKMEVPEWHLEIDREEISSLFSEGSELSSTVKQFLPRESQRQMALYVTDTLNSNQILVAEAGTGTGKSLAYLVPAARHAVKNNSRVIISTRTRNLQDQLISKDLPIAASLSGGELKYCTLKGRSNYLCRNRWVKLLTGELGNLSPRERFAILPLINWSETTVTGDIEEQNQFSPRWFAKIWNLINAEGHECTGRRCTYYSSCFLNKARHQAQSSHIVVINHALFYSDICSESSFLGPVGSIIFDEAHHLESSGHTHLRTELDTNRIKLFLDRIQNTFQSAGEYKQDPTISGLGKNLKTHLKHLRKRSKEMLQELAVWAKEEHPDSEREYQIGYYENSLSRLVELSAFDIILSQLQDTLSNIKQAAGALPESSEKKDDFISEVQSSMERTSQLRADLQYLSAAKTEDHVFWIEGNHEKNWTKLCGVPLDISSILSEIWERCKGGVVFTSATLATFGNTDYFRKNTGLFVHEKRTTSVVFPGPYSPDQMIAGGIRNAPDPDNPDFPPYAADAITTIHKETGKNILVLFTSNNMLKSVYNSLKGRSEIGNNSLLAQGYSGTRHAMLEQFKQSENMILLGTDSFWEGIDVPGESCEIVIMPRLPFPVPSHPLTRAVSRKVERESGDSFFSFSVPEALIKYRQGAGRLIRSSNDRGVLLVLDNRILSKGYGKQFTRSLKTDFQDFNSVEGTVSAMKNFFSGEPGEECRIRYEPLEDM